MKQKRIQKLKTLICEAAATVLILPLLMGTFGPAMNVQAKSDAALANRTYRLTDGVFKVVEVVPAKGQETLGVFMSEADGLSEEEDGATEQAQAGNAGDKKDLDGYSGNTRVINEHEAAAIRSEIQTNLTAYLAPQVNTLEELSKVQGLSDRHKAAIQIAVTSKANDLEKLRFPISEEDIDQEVYMDAESVIDWEDIKEFLRKGDQPCVSWQFRNFFDFEDELKDDRPITLNRIDGKKVSIIFIMKIKESKDDDKMEKVSDEDKEKAERAKKEGELMGYYEFTPRIMLTGTDIEASDITFTNKNWFREQVMGGDEEVTLQYEAKTMAELSTRDVSDVDLIYFGGANQMQSLRDLHIQYDPGAEHSSDNFENAERDDGEWLAMYKLYMRSISRFDRMAIVVPNRIPLKSGLDRDLRKLYTMLFYFNNPSNFRYFFKNGKFTTYYQFIEHLGDGSMYYGTAVDKGKGKAATQKSDTWTEIDKFDNYVRYSRDQFVYGSRGMNITDVEGFASEDYNNIYSYTETTDGFNTINGSMFEILKKTVLWQGMQTGTYSVILKADPNVVLRSDAAYSTGDEENVYDFYFNKFEIGAEESNDLYQGKYVTISFRIDGEDDEGHALDSEDTQQVTFHVTNAEVVPDRNGYHRIQVPYEQAVAGTVVTIEIDGGAFRTHNARITIKQQNMLTMS